MYQMGLFKLDTDKPKSSKITSFELKLSFLTAFTALSVISNSTCAVDTCMWLTCFKHTFSTFYAYVALCILNTNTIYIYVN